MPEIYLAYHAALALTVVTGAGFAWLLLAKARRAPGALPLAGFVLSAVAGVLGWGALTLFGPAAAWPAHLLIATAPLGAALFFHFAFAFTRRQPRHVERIVLGAYAVAGAVTIVGWLRPPGNIGPWLGFAAFYQIDWYGWIMVGTTTGLAVAGHLRLFLAWWGAGRAQRRQIAAVFIAALWGFSASLGFVWPSIGLEVFPYTALLMPGYIAILVYGVLRYEVMAVNLWARRTLTWLLVMLAAGLGAAALLAVGSDALTGEALGFWQSWVLGAAAVLFAALLLAPLRLVADRLVFPGGRVQPSDVATWRQALGAASDWRDLADRAQARIRRHLRAEIAVGIGPGEAAAAPNRPRLDCLREPDGWRCGLNGWDDAPPGPRHVGQIFADLVAEAANRLQQADDAARREGDRRRQMHLAELGTLAATIAHDLRNPLNIVNMAVAGTAPEIRRDVAEQLGRMDRLIADLLDYAAAWKAEPRPLRLLDEVEAASIGLRGAPVELAVPPDLTLAADPGKLRRVLVNLLANARAAAGPEGRVRVEAQRIADGAVTVDVLDDGPGVQPDIRERLFQPFVSRSAQGTGLGLAIVARIMEAHRGTAALAAREGWPTCFTLHFPAQAA